MSFTPPSGVGSSRRVIPAEVIGSVKKASDATGVNFAYLMAQAARESAFQPHVSSSQSSASGLFQFIQGTWLQLMKQHGAKYGYGELSKHIRRVKTGGFAVDDPKVLTKILALRKDPELSSMMAAEYARGNKAYLEKTLGREATPADLYMAHFLGPGGAAKLLKASRQNGAQSAAALFPKAAGSNRSIFYHPQTGRARSVASLCAYLASHVEEPIRRYAALQDATGAVVDPLHTGPVGESASFGNLIASAAEATSKSSAQATQKAVAILAVLEASVRSAPVVPERTATALKTLQNDISPQTTSLMAAVGEAAQRTEERTRQAEDFAARTMTAMNDLLPKAGEERPVASVPGASLTAVLRTATETTKERTLQAEAFAARTFAAVSDVLPKRPGAEEPTAVPSVPGSSVPGASLLAALDDAAKTTGAQTRQAEAFATRTMTAMNDILPDFSEVQAKEAVSPAGQPSAVPAPEEPPPLSSLLAAMEGPLRPVADAAERAEDLTRRAFAMLEEDGGEPAFTSSQSRYDERTFDLIASVDTDAVSPVAERVVQAYTPPEDAVSYRNRLAAEAAAGTVMASSAVSSVSPLPASDSSAAGGAVDEPAIQPLPPKVVIAASQPKLAPALPADDFETLAKLLQG